eukprot:m.165042 g.165042  ORF g.165042 m.165042 type:complete len:432 (-) comp15252_c0_seq5:1756-3051(-)
MAVCKAVRGMHDILPNVSRDLRLVRAIAMKKAEQYGYEEISTPILEPTNLFLRTIGSDTDVVSKEMYTFIDKGGDSLTLRPEGTAGVARAAVENKLILRDPLRLFYHGPMFRRERPQKGRLRQFHQFGVELIGDSHFGCDVESISLGASILDSLRVLEYTDLRINTLCDNETRERHFALLFEYLQGHFDNLSEGSQQKFSNGSILQILDSKDKGDQNIIANAPTIQSVASTESKERFEMVLDGLAAVGINYKIDHTLVRGLDYYTSTVWEFTTNHLGAQGTVLAGGRYDNLVSSLMRKNKGTIPAVGWAAGLERLQLLSMSLGIKHAMPNIVWLIEAHSATSSNNKNISNYCFKIASELRNLGHNVRHDYGTKLKKQLKLASDEKANIVLIVGENELHKETVTIKNMETGEQINTPSSELKNIDWLSQSQP